MKVKLAMFRDAIYIGGSKVKYDEREHKNITATLDNGFLKLEQAGETVLVPLSNVACIHLAKVAEKVEPKKVKAA